MINPHPSALKELKERGLEHIYKKSQSECLTWESLIIVYKIDWVEYLKIDTEGHYCFIINNILDSNTILPKKITFENNILSDKDYVSYTLDRLSKFGYRITSQGDFDTTVEKL